MLALTLLFCPHRSAAWLSNKCVRALKAVRTDRIDLHPVWCCRWSQVVQYHTVQDVSGPKDYAQPSKAIT
jgi:hypothetical protein